MTEQEYLTNYKKRGGIVYKCESCAFRGIGAATFYHEMKTGHNTIDEDRPEQKSGRIQSIIDETNKN